MSRQPSASDMQSQYKDQAYAYAQWDAASTTTSSSLLKDEDSSSGSRRKSSIGRAIDKAKSKLTGSEPVPETQEELEERRARALRKQERDAEYKRLGLGDRVKFGSSGAGGYNSM